jgi:hypothetical protein
MSALQSRSDIDIYDLHSAALRDLTLLCISRILSSAVAFDHALTAPFLRLNLGVPNDIYTHRKTLRGEDS